MEINEVESLLKVWKLDFRLLIEWTLQNLWQGMYLRWIVDLSPQRDANRKVEEIVERNRSAKTKVLQLRRKLVELEGEAEKLGLLLKKNQAMEIQ